MLNGSLNRWLKKKDEEPPVEALDVEAIRSRIGEPLQPKKKAAVPEYMRSDGRPNEERSWRKAAGLSR